MVAIERRVRFHLGEKRKVEGSYSDENFLNAEILETMRLKMLEVTARYYRKKTDVRSLIHYREN